MGLEEIVRNLGEWNIWHICGKDWDKQIGRNQGGWNIGNTIERNQGGWNIDNKSRCLSAEHGRNHRWVRALYNLLASSSTVLSSAFMKTVDMPQCNLYKLQFLFYFFPLCVFTLVVLEYLFERLWSLGADCKLFHQTLCKLQSKIMLQLNFGCMACTVQRENIVSKRMDGGPFLKRLLAQNKLRHIYNRRFVWVWSLFQKDAFGDG